MLGCLLAALMLACTTEESPGGADEALPASLSISLSAVDVSVDARGLEDPDGDLASWTAMERAIDGREIYRISLFLVNSDRTLVAYRDLYKSSPDVDAENGFWTGVSVGENLAVGKEVKATFDHRAYKVDHGSVEQLVQGEYTLIAVANFAAYEDVNDPNLPKYGGLMNGEFSKLVERIKGAMDPKVGLADFSFANANQNSDGYRFFHASLDAGRDFVCPKQPQPLTLVKKIALRPGQNFVTGELKRTYARIRINLANQSEKFLQNNSLSFDTRFARQFTYLFDNPDDRDFIYSYPSTSSGAPDVRSSDAVVPYEPSVLEANSSQVIFDAYVLESRGEAEFYRYWLNVGYGKAGLPLSEVPVTSVAGLEEWIAMNQEQENVYCLIKRSDNDYYLGDNGSGFVVAQKRTNSNLDALLWKVTDGGKLENGDQQYQIRSYAGNYIGRLYGYDDLGAFMLDNVACDRNGAAHVLADQDFYNFQTHCKGISIEDRVADGGRFYLMLDRGYMGGEVSSLQTQTPGMAYEFFPVRYYPFDGNAVSFTQPIQLQTIDPVTSQVSDVSNIRRNDFITIYINSSYSDANGIFSFEVLPWVAKGAEIEYH